MQAETQCNANNPTAAFEILFDLLSDPHASLETRTHVNLLLARMTRVGEHPGKKTYARECLEGFALLRAAGSVADGANVAEMETEARQIIDDVNKDIGDVDIDFDNVEKTFQNTGRRSREAQATQSSGAMDEIDMPPPQTTHTPLAFRTSKAAETTDPVEAPMPPTPSPHASSSVLPTAATQVLLCPRFRNHGCNKKFISFEDADSHALSHNNEAPFLVPRETRSRLLPYLHLIECRSIPLRYLPSLIHEELRLSSERSSRLPPAFHHAKSSQSAPNDTRGKQDPLSTILRAHWLY